MTFEEIMEHFRSISDNEKLDKMNKFGIITSNALGGITIPMLRKLAKKIGKNHDTACKLWDSGFL